MQEKTIIVKNIDKSYEAGKQVLFNICFIRKRLVKANLSVFLYVSNELSEKNKIFLDDMSFPGLPFHVFIYLFPNIIHN